MQVVRAYFPLGSDSHECVDKRMHCSPSLQLLGTLIWLLQLVLILRWWSFDWVVLFLLGWNPALAIANTDSTCQGQHWELQFPQVTRGRGEEKNPKDSCWIQLGRWHILQDILGIPDTCNEKNKPDLRYFLVNPGSVSSLWHQWAGTSTYWYYHPY